MRLGVVSRGCIGNLWIESRVASGDEDFDDGGDSVCGSGIY